MKWKTAREEKDDNFIAKKKHRKVGNKFITIDSNTMVSVGKLVTLTTEDINTPAPMFEREDTKEMVYINWYRLKPIMSVKEYIKKKNEILKEHTGITLVPEDQITNPELLTKLNMGLDRFFCPYCVLYSCYECPMSKAGNECMDNDSSYQRIRKDTNNRLRSIHTPFHSELKELVEEFNLGRTDG